MLDDLIYEWKDLFFALIIGGVVPGILVYVALGILREARAARHWPKTTGTVITSRVESREKKPKDAEVRNLPLLEYEYHVNNRPFRGWGITIASSSANELKRIRDRYPVGAKVAVRYNPADPQQAVLEGDVSESELLGRFLLLVSVAIPFVALLLFNNIVSEGILFTLFACAVVPVGFMVVMIIKYREIRAAGRWLQTTGTVITSSVESHKKQPGDIDYDDSDTEVINSPLVVYEYQVNGQSYRGSRITIGERTSAYELESILDRHPVGAQVDVYYNPADPQEAVLERDFPASVYWTAGGCLLFTIAVPVIAILIYHIGLTWFNEGAIVLGGMGLATLGLAIAYTAMSAQASRWPIARGRIVAADVEAFYARTRRRRTYFKPSVLYAYEVNGRQYLGDRVRLVVVVSSTIPGLAGHTAAKYPVGMEVDVHYNPKKPSESVLHPWSWWVVFPWLILVGLFILGWALGGAK